MNDILFTDLYQYRMALVYFKQGKTDLTTGFTFYIRPCEERPFYAVYGTEELVNIIYDLRFSKDDIDYLETIFEFEPQFLDYLRTWRFKGKIYYVPSGFVVDSNQPIFTVESDPISCQILETLIINYLQSRINFLSKAVLIRKATDKLLIEMGARRAQSIESADIASLMWYIGTNSPTSNTFVGKKYGIPVTGTMAHSFIMMYGEGYEIQAFRDFVNIYRDKTIFLVDTYNIEQGIKNASKVAKEFNLGKVAIRIDSGDLLQESVKAREILKSLGWSENDIVVLVSGDLNEHKIRQLEPNDVIDGYGIGTEYSSLKDKPALNAVYKLNYIKDGDRYIYTKKKAEGKTNINTAIIAVSDQIYAFKLDESIPETFHIITKEASTYVKVPTIDVTKDLLRNNYLIWR